MRIIYNARAKRESYANAVTSTIAALDALDKDEEWQATLASILARSTHGDTK